MLDGIRCCLLAKRGKSEPFSESLHRREWQLMTLTHPTRAQDPVPGEDHWFTGLLRFPPAQRAAENPQGRRQQGQFRHRYEGRLDCPGRCLDLVEPDARLVLGLSLAPSPGN